MKGKTDRGPKSASGRTTKSPLTVKKARSAAKAAKKVYSKRATKKSATWKKGGEAYARVLGHFGQSA